MLLHVFYLHSSLSFHRVFEFLYFRMFLFQAYCIMYFHVRVVSVDSFFIGLPHYLHVVLFWLVVSII